MFLTLCSPATRDFRPVIRRADFAQLALVLLLVPLSIKESHLQIAVSNQIQGTSQDFEEKHHSYSLFPLKYL